MADMNQPGGGEPAGGQGAAPGDSPGDIRNWCMGAHLSGLVGFIGPLIVWLIKKDSSPEVGAHAREALNFQLTIFIVYVAGYILLAIVAMIPFLGHVARLLMIPFWLAMLVFWLVFLIKGAMTASEGRPYQYPFSLHLIK